LLNIDNCPWFELETATSNSFLPLAPSTSINPPPIVVVPLSLLIIRGSVWVFAFCAPVKRNRLVLRQVAVKNPVKYCFIMYSGVVVILVGGKHSLDCAISSDNLFFSSSFKI